MPLKIGIIGLPNVGKSTLFKALTKRAVVIENYPFATIDPNIGAVNVPDERLLKLQSITKSQKIIPTIIEFVDIAGLVKNAHQGEGLGNQFLAHIREVDALIHLIRQFNDPQIAHLTGAIDTDRDQTIINQELIMADLNTVSKKITAVKGRAQTGDAEAKILLDIYLKLQTRLKQGSFAREVDLGKEIDRLADLKLLTAKPIIRLFNTDQESLSSSSLSANSPALSLNIKQELALSELSLEELNELGIKKTRLAKLIQLAYQLLDLITFFTFNEKEIRAWTLKNGDSILQAAGKVHSDFAQGFIRGEVINWQKLITAGSWTKAKEEGLINIEGREYLVQDGDVIYFRYAL